MLSTVEKVLFLMRAPATVDASTDALARLAGLAEEIEAPMGTRLFSAGDPPEALFILLDGAVRVAETDEEARLLGPGDVAGGLALFAAATHATTATCVVTSRLLRLARADLYDLLDEDGELARALFTGLVRVLAAHHPGALAA